MQLYNIINGWKNYITKDKDIELLANERVVNCVSCEYKKESKVFGWVKDEVTEINATVCSLCDCPIAMKIRSKNEKCPKGKW
jgi:hypothetical protein